MNYSQMRVVLLLAVLFIGACLAADVVELNAKSFAKATEGGKVLFVEFFAPCKYIYLHFYGIQN